MLMHFTLLNFFLIVMCECFKYQSLQRMSAKLGMLAHGTPCLAMYH